MVNFNFILDYTMIRVLSGKKLNYNFIASSNAFGKSINFFGISINFDKKEELQSHNLLIHVHGGGYFAQTSESHLGYLIK